MSIDFYYTPGSAPCRSVLLTAAALDVKLNLKHMNLMQGEHLKPEFLKINPLHCVPTIDDNGFKLWESRAIMQYLANKYGKSDCYYPKDPQKRAKVDQMLFFDMGTMYNSFAAYYYPQIFGGAPHNEEKFQEIAKAFEKFESILSGNKYAAGGDHLTIADLTLVSSVSTIDVLNYDISPYKNVTAWYERIKNEAPNYKEANGDNVLLFKQLVDQLKKK